MAVLGALIPFLVLGFGGPEGLTITPDKEYIPPEPEWPSSDFPITDPSYEPVYMGVGAEPDAQAALNSPTVLFVNFDGPFMNGGCGNDSRNDCSTLFGNTQFTPSPADDSTRAAIIQATREDVVDFGVIVVGERPPAGNPYAMVVVGLPNGMSTGGVGGVAPGIDCGNNNPNITSFSFLVDASANTQATVIHQEAAHTWGLEHVDDTTDNLYPTAGGTLDPKYQDTCSQVVADTSLTPTSSGCNQIHTMFCAQNMQNSYQEMLALFGPPIPDQTAPTVTIDEPADGSTFGFEDDFDLTLTLDDDRRPQVLDTVIYFDDTEVTANSLINTTVSFGIPGGPSPSGHGLSNGEHVIRVEITDEAGNPASDEVTITIEGNPDMSGGDETGDDGGSGDGGDDGGDDGSGGSGSDGTGFPADGGDDGGKGCGCTSSPAPTWSLLLLVLPFAFRRRR